MNTRSERYELRDEKERKSTKDRARKGVSKRRRKRRRRRRGMER